jgi:hypothetical protein
MPVDAAKDRAFNDCGCGHLSRKKRGSSSVKFRLSVPKGRSKRAQLVTEVNLKKRYRFRELAEMGFSGERMKVRIVQSQSCNRLTKSEILSGEGSVGMRPDLVSHPFKAT